MYYPKSQIQENLSSNGDLSYKSDGNPYYGFYYKISTGKYFTGKTPQDGPNEELILFQGELNVSSLVDENSKTPIYYLNAPVDNDYQFGSFIRYFCKKANELIYIEISKQTFDKLVNKDPKIYWELYVPFSIKWKLTGSREAVYKTNKNLVELTIQNQKLYQFDNYLKKDYLKFW
jgi:hypothetical protein